MSKASPDTNEKPIESRIDIKLISKEMKRNFTRFMTKLGAHIAHLAAFGVNHSLKYAERFGHFIKSKTEPRVRKLFNAFAGRKHCVLSCTERVQSYFYDLDDKFCEIKVNEGVFPALRHLFSTLFGTAWGFKGGLVTAFNWAAPALSIVFLVGVVNFATNLNYGVSVECNGEELGIITEETAYDEAEKALQDRITYVEGNEKVIIKSRLSVQIVRDNSQIVNANQLVDKMIDNSNADLANAYGIYVGGQFLGAVKDREPIMNTLAGMLAKYQTPGVKSVSFQKSVEYKDGLYVKSSLVSPDKILNQLTAQTQVPAYYTIQDGDTPLKIASKNGLRLSELVALNPSIEKSCQIGDSVVLTRAEAYMPVQVVKDVQYTETTDYETIEVENNSAYKGDKKVLVKGEEGETAVTAEVTYVNGYEVGRTIISSVVTKKPVTEKLSVGTLVPSPSKSTKLTGNGKYCWPVAGGYISAYMGDGRGHKGIDIAAPKGTSIFAADSGTVIMSQRYYDYGYCIMIQHSDGYITVYGHQSQLLVSVGQKVEKGQLIGLVGRTGEATGNHLHFEVRVNGKVANPMNFFG